MLTPKLKNNRWVLEDISQDWAPWSREAGGYENLVQLLVDIANSLRNIQENKKEQK